MNALNFLKLLLYEILEEKTRAPSPMPLNGHVVTPQTCGQPPDVSNFWSPESFTINIPNVTTQSAPDHDLWPCVLLLALTPFNLNFPWSCPQLLSFATLFTCLPAFHQPLTSSWQALSATSYLSIGLCNLWLCWVCSDSAVSLEQ